MLPFPSWRHLRLCLLAVFAAGFLASAVFYAGHRAADEFAVALDVPPARVKKLILAWTGYWEHKTWLPDLSGLRCPVSDCDVTHNRSRLEESSAVILHLANVDPDRLPRCRTAGCERRLRYVLYHHEPPTQTYVGKMKRLAGKIHWTITYRSDSDVYAPYGKVIRRTEPYDPPAVAQNRSLVCWLVSHCETHSRREDYVAAMQLHVPVQVYGKCGRPCGEKGRYECYAWLAERCKFYLSFENSVCDQYATEKLFIPMMSGDMVPVVLGGADYARLLPPRSYVDTADFGGPEELAQFLQELGEDQDRYREYLAWKSEYAVRGNDQNWLCDVCRKLHETKGEELAKHEDLYAWWSGGASCRTPKF